MDNIKKSTNDDIKNLIEKYNLENTKDKINIENYKNIKEFEIYSLFLNNNIVGFFIINLKDDIKTIIKFYIFNEYNNKKIYNYFALNIILFFKEKINILINKSNYKTWKNISKKFKEKKEITKNETKFISINPMSYDNRTLSEKFEDGLDEVVMGTQDLILGEKKNIKEDIPATIEKPNGIRTILKAQTRQNINKKLFSNKTFVKVILAIFLIGLGFTILINIISKLI